MTFTWEADTYYVTVLMYNIALYFAMCFVSALTVMAVVFLCDTQVCVRLPGHMVTVLLCDACTDLRCSSLHSYTLCE